MYQNQISPRIGERNLPTSNMKLIGGKGTNNEPTMNNFREKEEEE